MRGVALFELSESAKQTVVSGVERLNLLLLRADDSLLLADDALKRHLLVAKTLLLSGQPASRRCQARVASR